MTDSGLSLVRASGLSKTYVTGRTLTPAILEASFEIMPGDQIAVTGPSGSGKSTLLHLIGALDVPTTGTIEWPGLGSAGSLRPGLVSFSFQGPSLLPPLSVLENVALPLLLLDKPEEEAREAALEMIARLDLTDVADKLPEEISGGQAQRGSVARALVGAPRLVLADEPTGQLDRAHAHDLLDVIVETVSRTGASLVVATHDRMIADRLHQSWRMVDRRLDAGVWPRSR